MGPAGKGYTQRTRARKQTIWTALAAAAALMLVFALAAGVTGCMGRGETTTTTFVTLPDDETTTTVAEEEEVTTESTEAEEVTTESTVAEEETSSTDTSTTEGSTTTTEKLTIAEQRLDNGNIKAMGFISSVGVKDHKRYITIDYALMLTGQDAVDAAVKAGEIQPGEELPNDYYISNTNHETRTYEVADDVEITTSSWQDEQNKSVTWDEFVSFWSDTPPDEQAGFLSESPWWTERDGQTIVKIDEQYLP